MMKNTQINNKTHKKSQVDRHNVKQGMQSFMTKETSLKEISVHKDEIFIDPTLSIAMQWLVSW